MKQLSQQQKRFINEYIKTLDGETSAKNAGYKSKDLKSLSNELLSNRHVINEIKLQLQNHIASLRVHKGYVIQKLLQIAEFSLEEEDILDKEGNVLGVAEKTAIEHYLHAKILEVHQKLAMLG